MNVNRNHVWVTNFLYELPFGQGQKFMAMPTGSWTLSSGGWRVTSITTGAEVCRGPRVSVTAVWTRCGVCRRQGLGIVREAQSGTRTGTLLVHSGLYYYSGPY